MPFNKEPRYGIIGGSEQWVDHGRGIAIWVNEIRTLFMSPRFEVQWHHHAFRFEAGFDLTHEHSDGTRHQKWNIKAVELPEKFPETHEAVCAVFREFIVAYNAHPYLYTHLEIGVYPDVFERLTFDGLMDRDRFLSDYLDKTGKSRPRNEQEELRLFEEAAEEGDAAAQFHLVDLYEFATPNPESPDNVATAVHWLQKSALQGYSEALARLKSINHEFVLGLAKITRQPTVHAQMAVRYEKGLNVAVDLKEAYFWWCLSTKFGNSKASVLRRDALATKLSPQDRAEIEKRAEQWDIPPSKPT